MGHNRESSGNTAKSSANTGPVAFGDVRFNSRTGELQRTGSSARVTPKAAALLAVLLERAPELVTKEELLARVWDGKPVGDDALTSCVQELRQALGDEARQPRFIETQHRRGYRWIAPVVSTMAGTQVGSSEPARLFGRQKEMSELWRRFDMAQAGQRQFVLVTGEPGIGKTALVDCFIADISRANNCLVALGQCLDQHGVGEPYLPLIEALMRVASGSLALPIKKILSEQAPSWLAHMPSLLSEVEREVVARRGIAPKGRMLHELTVALEAVTASTPLVLRLEDLHWSDASTLDWVSHAARRLEPARLMIVGTMRPVGSTAGQRTMGTLLAELALHNWCQELALSPLASDAIEEFLRSQLGDKIQPNRLTHIVSRLQIRTGGNPLFLVSLARQLVQTGLSSSEAFAEVPGNVRRHIEQQIDGLHERDRDILMAASVIGREFAPRLVGPVIDEPVEAIEHACAHLAQANVLINASGATTWPDATRSDLYTFRHDLYREALYNRLSATACERAHITVGRALEQAWASHPDAIAVELADHFDRGRDFGRAVPHYQRAAAKAQRRGANQQAIDHLNRALRHVGYLADDAERIRCEAELYVAIGSAHAATRGFGAPEVADALAQAEMRCERLGESADLFPVIWGQWLFRWGRSDLKGCQSLAVRMLGLAQQVDDTGLKLQAHHAMWTTMFGVGDLKLARAHAKAGLLLYDPSKHAAMASNYGNHDACICGRNFTAIALALAGEEEDARTIMRQALKGAMQLGDPYSQAMMYYSTSVAAQVLGDVSLATESAENSRRISTEYVLGVQRLLSSGVLGWCMAARGHRKEGLALLREAIASLKAAKSVLFMHYLLALLADASLAAGELRDALDAAKEGIAIAETTGERFYLAELYRLAGVLLFRSAAEPKVQAREWLERAIELASEQGATLLERKARASSISER